MSRVVVTGMGEVTPIGNNLIDMWSNILAGKHGISTVSKVNPDDYKISVAAEVKNFDPEAVMRRRDAKRMDLYALYAVVAAEEAFKMSGFKINENNQFDVGVIVGSGSGGYMAMQDNVIRLKEKGLNKVEALFHVKTPVNMAAANIAMRFEIGRASCRE